MRRQLALTFAVTLLAACTGQRNMQQARETYPEGMEGRAMLRSAPAADPQLNRSIADAADAYQLLLAKNPQAVPTTRLRDDAACVAIVPNYTNTALLVGSSGGRGIVTCKAAGAGSSWSAPSFFTMSNMTLGAQVGHESSSVITYVIGNDAVSRFTRGDTFKLGSDIGATAGSTSGNLAFSARGGASSYVVDRKGAFMGVSLSGSSITPDTASDERYYGAGMTPDQILTSPGMAPMSPDAERLISMLPV